MQQDNTKVQRGFTIVEVIASICIISLIALSTLRLLGESGKIFNSIDKDVEIRSNLRIALDFLYCTIRDGNSIIINDKITVDGEDIYLKNKILRYNTDSQQIAVGIDNFSIYCSKTNLYKITVTGGGYSYCTYVKQRIE